MKTQLPRKKKTQETREVERILRESLPGAEVEAYRYNSASIRVRVVHPFFAGKSRISREKKVLPLLDRLPEETQADITLLLLLTPAERQDSLMNLEFDDPTPSRL